MIQNRGSDPLQAVPLASISASGTYIVDKVSGSEQQRLRLCELGIVVGSPLSIISANKGMRVVKVGGSRMALSAGTTENIWLQPKKS